MTDRDGRTLLQVATLHNAKAVAKVLLGVVNVDVDAPGQFDLTPLQIASTHRDGKIVKCLLQAKARMEVTNSHGYAPLHFAALSGSTKSVRLLLKAGADPNVRSRSGCTPLHTAAQYGATEPALTLIKAGANSGIANKRGQLAADLVPEAQRDEFCIILESSSTQAKNSLFKSCLAQRRPFIGCLSGNFLSLPLPIAMKARAR